MTYRYGCTYASNRATKYVRLSNFFTDGNSVLGTMGVAKTSRCSYPHHGAIYSGKELCCDMIGSGRWSRQCWVILQLLLPSYPYRNLSLFELEAGLYLAIYLLDAAHISSFADR
eukprot:4200962-Pleurochrysis_carterae.AAC.5